MKPVQKALPLFLFLLIVGCSSPQDTASEMRSVRSSASEVMAKNISPPMAGASEPVTQLTGASRARPQLASNPVFVPQRSIIRNADLAVRVKSIEPAERSIEHLVAGEQGYVDSAASTDLASDHPELKLTLRVPVGTFDSTVAAIEGMGTRLSKTVNSQDVTGNLVDLDARLASMSAEEQTYQSLLRHAESMDNAMNLRDKLTDLRSQIESIAGQRKSMGQLASLSTITVSLTQSAVGAAPPQDAGWFQETWGQATGSSLAAARFAGGLGIWAIALLPFWLPLVLLCKALLSRARQNIATPRAESSTNL